LNSCAQLALKSPFKVEIERNSLFFSLLAGNFAEETGSYVTASATILPGKLRSGFPT